MVLFGWPFHYAHGWQNPLSKLMNYSWVPCWIWQLLFWLFSFPSISLFFLSAACPLAPIDELLPWKPNMRDLGSLCRRESELQKAEQLPEFVPLWWLLKEQYGRLRPDLVLQSHLEYCRQPTIPFLSCFFKTLPFLSFACGAGSHGCRLLLVINCDRLCALGIEPLLL